MGRYHPPEKKKSGKILYISAILAGMITAAGWIYFNEYPSGGLIKTEGKTLPLPIIDNPTVWAEPPEPTVPTDLEPGSAPAGVADDSAQEGGQVLPELSGSDSFVRDELLKRAPDLSPWLQTDQLIRKFLLIINDFSQGQRLEKHMRFLRPAQPFSAGQDKDGLFMAESSYHRYDALAAAIDALEVGAVMAFYQKIRPLLMQVYSEFSYPEGYRLEDIFLKAGAEILAAPVITGRIALIRPSVLYKFADPQNEALNSVHKQMLRLGPKNTRLIQGKVRKLLEALADRDE